MKNFALLLVSLVAGACVTALSLIMVWGAFIWGLKHLIGW